MKMLNESCVVVTPEVILALREHKSDKRIVDLPTLTTIVRLLENPTLVSLSDIADKAELPANDVIEAVIQLGSWICRARAKSGIDVIFVADLPIGTQPELFGNLTEVPRGLKKGIADTVTVVMPKGKTSGVQKGRNGRTKVVTYGNQVLVNDSWSPQAIGKDIKGSIAEIIAAQLSESELARYVQRTTSRDKMLAFEHVTTVWLFARLDRLNELTEISPNSIAASQCLADAYDVLELARCNAMRALRTLCSDTVSVEQVRDSVVALRPVAESLVRPLAGLVETTSDSSERALRTELRWLRRQVETNTAALVCRHIGQLNQGQVLRIAQSAGLHTGGSSQVEESAIRARLSHMGLSGDADQLVTTGVQAIRLGLNDEFWEAVERRSGGDPRWDKPLAAAMRKS